MSTLLKPVPFSRGYQCQNYTTHDGLNSHSLLGDGNSLMDNKKYDSLLFKSRASPILQNLLITFLGMTSFFGVSFNFMQVMTYDMGTSPGHRKGGLIFCILRGLSLPHRKNLLRGSFSISIFRDIYTTAYEKKESSVKHKRKLQNWYLYI